MKTFFGIIAIILTLGAYIPYIRDIIKGKTTPHAYTWFTFGLATALIFGLQISSGGGIGAYVTLIMSITIFIIFIFSLLKGETKISLLDTIFFTLALIALALWLFAKQPILSVILLSLINILAFAPTIRKSWTKPFSETMSTYIMNGSKHAATFLALAHYSVVTYLFPLSASFVTFLFVFILIVRRKIVNNGNRFY